MNTSWPVRIAWRASFVFELLAAAANGARGDGADARARAAALVVAARAQDPAELPRWQRALHDGAPAVRAAAAFAIGQLGVAWESPSEAVRAQAEAALLAAWAGERDAEVRGRLVEALGKVGTRAALARLTAALDGRERVRAALALGLLAKNRQLLATQAAPRLRAMLATDGDAEARWAAALALLRLRDAEARPELARALGDGDGDVRATAAKALAEVGGDGEAAALAARVGDGDVRVAAEAARALVKLAMKCGPGACVPLQALAATRGPWPPPVMQAVAFERWRDARALPMLAARADEYARAPAMEPRARALAECTAAWAHDRALGRIERLRGCGGARMDERLRALRMAQALVDVGGPALMAMAKSPHAAVRAVVAEGADAATTLALLGDADAAVVGAAAERVAALKLVEAAPALVAAAGRLRGADTVEAQQAILETAERLRLAALLPAAKARLDAEPYALRQAAGHVLAALEGPAVRVRPPALPAASAAVAKADAATRAAPLIVRLRTTRGTIRARLWSDDAPATAGNFVALVRRGFYDGLTFHRMVPDYVSQGGDPRGDGSGGPGYLIPCEIGMRRYQAGTLGMALSGRDTGGSQFFFAHAPEPHLDGRYTAFGAVIEGLDVVTHLIEGDVILDARLE